MVVYSSVVSLCTIQVNRVVRSKRNPFDHASLSNEETKDFEKELDEIDKKFNEARGAKLKYN